MFNFFKKKNECPIPDTTRVWMENAFIWLMKEFGEKELMSRQTLLPGEDNNPIKSENVNKVAGELLEILCTQMEVDSKKVKISFLHQSLFTSIGDTGQAIIAQQSESYSAGLYMGRQEDGTYSISVEIGELVLPSSLLSTLAHEIAHIKLLGESRLKENDEYLTDLVTVFFGIGIFNANAAFNFFSTSNSWGYRTQGYLTQQEWGYALSLYAYIRREKNPSWIEYLTPNILSDFKKCEKYIYANTDKVLI